MPIYEYRCPSCGHKFEKLVRMGAPAPACPECGDADVTKLISAAGFILKGGGWYKDHYGLKSSKPSAKNSGDAGASSSGGSDSSESSGSSESKTSTPTSGD